MSIFWQLSLESDRLTATEPKNRIILKTEVLVRKREWAADTDSEVVWLVKHGFSMGDQFYII